MTDDQIAIQPCEMCGKTTPPNEDDKYDDVYTEARIGSKAFKLGLGTERLCGRCACAQFIGSYWNGSPEKKLVPIEQYHLPFVNRTVFVKRDDLWNGAKYCGGNAKMRGIEVHLRGLIDRGIQHIAVMDSRTSRIGWGVAELCRDLKLKCTVFYGTLKKDTGLVPIFQQRARDAGAQLFEMPASRIYPMYYKARIYCRENNMYLMPMGGQLNESMLSISGEVVTLPANLRKGTIVCVVATGTLFAGLLLGLHDAGRVIGVYIGMTSGEVSGRTRSDPESIIRGRIRGLLPQGFDPVDFEIQLGDREYYDEDNYPCPFNCDKWYDRKAWRWLCQNIHELDDPVLFWNIG